MQRRIIAFSLARLSYCPYTVLPDSARKDECARVWTLCDEALPLFFSFEKFRDGYSEKNEKDNLFRSEDFRLGGLPDTVYFRRRVKEGWMSRRDTRKKYRR